MALRSIRQVKNLAGKRALVRCDFDVPLSHKNTENTKAQKHKDTIKILDDTRLKACLPTIEFLLKKNVKQIILCGHLGRPNGKIVPKLNLVPVRERLEELLNKELRIKNYELSLGFIKDFTACGLQLAAYKIIMLENLRFYPGEEKNDLRFAKQLSTLADIYVNEAFAVSHRRAASVSAVQKYLPSYAGLNLEHELQALGALVRKSKKPLILIIGGAKIETKLPVIRNFLNKADHILVGGAVANNFLKALGCEIGRSVVDEEYVDEAKNILSLKIKNLPSFLTTDNSLFLPIDVITQTGLVKKLVELKKSDKILDLGPKTIKLYCNIIKTAGTIVWNGPLGKFEDKKFQAGTRKIAQAVSKSKAKIIIGGGETGEAIVSLLHCSIADLPKNIFVSTGGGAMLDFLAGKKLPGL